MNRWKQWTTVRPGYWFAPRLFGWGATPVTWQGWTLTLGCVAVIVAISRSNLADLPKTMLVGVLLAALVALSWFKTDGGWRWRWGSMDR